MFTNSDKNIGTITLKYCTANSINPIQIMRKITRSSHMNVLVYLKVVITVNILRFNVFSDLSSLNRMYESIKIV